MEPKDIANLFITSTDKIEFYWNFYTVTLLAIIGWLVSTNKMLAPRLKVLITSGYLLFVTMNIMAIWNSQSFAEALRLDLLSALEPPSDALHETREVLTQLSFEDKKVYALCIHGILGACVLSVIWFGRWNEPVQGQDE